MFDRLSHDQVRERMRTRLRLPCKGRRPKKVGRLGVYQTAPVSDRRARQSRSRPIHGSGPGSTRASRARIRACATREGKAAPAEGDPGCDWPTVRPGNASRLEGPADRDLLDDGRRNPAQTRASQSSSRRPSPSARHPILELSLRSQKGKEPTRSSHRADGRVRGAPPTCHY